jgi:hypothetical protein
VFGIVCHHFFSSTLRRRRHRRPCCPQEMEIFSVLVRFVICALPSEHSLPPFPYLLHVVITLLGLPIVPCQLMDPSLVSFAHVLSTHALSFKPRLILQTNTSTRLRSPGSSAIRGLRFDEVFSQRLSIRVSASRALDLYLLHEFAWASVYMSISCPPESRPLYRHRCRFKFHPFSSLHHGGEFLLASDSD